MGKKKKLGGAVKIKKDSERRVWLRILTLEFFFFFLPGYFGQKEIKARKFLP